MKIATLKISLSHVLKASKAQTAAAQQRGHVQHSFPLPVNAQLPRSNHCGALLPRCHQECPISANLFLVTWAPVTKEPEKITDSVTVDPNRAQTNRPEVNSKTSAPTA